MERVARRRLLNLPQQDLIASHHQVAQTCACVNSAPKMMARNARGDHRDLDYRSSEAQPRAEPRHRADCALVANRRSLDPPAIAHDGEK